MINRYYYSLDPGNGIKLSRVSLEYEDVANTYKLKLDVGETHAFVNVYPEELEDIFNDVFDEDLKYRIRRAMIHGMQNDILAI